MAENNALWNWGNQQTYHEKIKQEIEKASTGGVTIDDALSTESTNAIQNKAVAEALTKKLDKNPTTFQTQNGKVLLTENSEGGNLRLTSPDGTLYMEQDCYNNNMYRCYAVKDGATKAVWYFDTVNNIFTLYPVVKVNSATAAETSQVRNIAAGTAAATTSNCPNGALYGQYS